MSRICFIAGRRRHKANSVSHANNRTRKWQLPNLRNKRIFDEQTGEWVCLRVSARGIKTIMKKGLRQALADVKE
ncbi:50S ribosomal protein L28 [candidate division KSB1 bacterium]|nr:MAG: 50S ribosomal protein L28 [candidate division KSB1 bacterium]